MGACGATCGINKEREREKASALAAAARAYPDFVWRRERAAAFGARPVDAVRELGAHLEEVLPVRAIVRLGERDACDALYLLAGVHAPCLVELLDGVAPAPSTSRDDDATPSPLRARETYVRVAFSPLGPYVTLQEVVVTASLDDDAIAIVEAPVLGVEDRRLQLIVKGLQGALRKAKLTVLDMAFVAGPPPGTGTQRAFEESYGGTPTLWSLLFEPAPPTTTRAAIVPARVGDPRCGRAICTPARVAATRRFA